MSYDETPRARPKRRPKAARRFLDGRLTREIRLSRFVAVLAWIGILPATFVSFLAVYLPVDLVVRVGELGNLARTHRSVESGFSPSAFAWSVVAVGFLLGLWLDRDPKQEITIPNPQPGSKGNRSVQLPDVRRLGLLGSQAEGGLSSFFGLRSLLMLAGSLFLLGPQLLMFGWRHFRRSLRLGGTDRAGCAAVLAVVVAEDRRVPFRALFDELPDLDPVRVLPQLHDLGVVQWIRNEPHGLAAASELRDGFAAASGGSGAKKSPGGGARNTTPRW